jgi:hypothetical protein
MISGFVRIVCTVTPFDNRTLSYIGSIARSCIECGIGPDVTWLRAPSSALSQLLVRRSLDSKALTEVKAAQDTLHRALGPIPLVNAIECLIRYYIPMRETVVSIACSDLQLSADGLKGQAPSLAAQLRDLREAEAVCSQHPQLQHLFTARSPLDLTVTDEIPAEVNRIRVALMNAQSKSRPTSSSSSASSSGSDSRETPSLVELARAVPIASTPADASARPSAATSVPLMTQPLPASLSVSLTVLTGVAKCWQNVLLAAASSIPKAPSLSAPKKVKSSFPVIENAVEDQESDSSGEEAQSDHQRQRYSSNRD